MSVLWETFEIAINFFQGFILIWFPYSYLGDKNNRKFYKSQGIAYAIIIAATISIMNRLTAFEHFYAVIYVAVAFLYTYTNLNGSLLKKTFAVVFPNLEPVPIGAVCGFAARFCR